MVVGVERDPERLTKRIYVLSCGHRVSREPATHKRWCLCGYCGKTYPTMGQILSDPRIVDAAWEREVAMAYSAAADQQGELE